LALQEKQPQEAGVEEPGAQETEAAIVMLAIEQPAFGEPRVANELRQRGLTPNERSLRADESVITKSGHKWLAPNLAVRHIAARRRWPSLSVNFLLFILDSPDRVRGYFGEEIEAVPCIWSIYRLVY
jgi:hypothetical protein